MKSYTETHWNQPMTKDFAFNMIVKDIKASIDCQDSEDDYEILKEALCILEGHLRETYCTDVV